MKGLKVNINSQELIAAASDGCLIVILSAEYRPDYRYIHIGGVDSMRYHTSWLDQDLKIGDKIKLRVADIETVSELQSRVPSDREQMKQDYYRLKELLREKGLI